MVFIFLVESSWTLMVFAFPSHSLSPFGVLNLSSQAFLIQKKRTECFGKQVSGDSDLIGSKHREKWIDSRDSMEIESVELND